MVQLLLPINSSLAPAREVCLEESGSGVLSSVPKKPEIPGLNYIRSFLGQKHQQGAIERIDKQPWLSDLHRRVQHYGWRYDYRARTISRDMEIGPLPDWLREIADLLYQKRSPDGKRYFEATPNQVIVNEYEPGQGIAMHVDRHCFGPTIATISLGDDWQMEFLRVGSSAYNKHREHMLLEQGSALVLTGEARNTWMHGIATRKSDPDPDIAGKRRNRQRRISLTFRTVPAGHHP